LHAGRCLLQACYDFIKPFTLRCTADTLVTAVTSQDHKHELCMTSLNSPPHVQSIHMHTNPSPNYTQGSQTAMHMHCYPRFLLKTD